MLWRAETGTIWAMASILAMAISTVGCESKVDRMMEIWSACDSVYNVHPIHFEGPMGAGIAAGEALERRGVRLDWSRGGALRKANWSRTCRQVLAE